MKKLLYISAFAILIGSCKKDSDGFEANTGSYDHSQSVGNSANDLLSSKTYQSITVEILYMPGFALNSSTTTHLTNFLNARLNKPGGVNIQSREIPATSNSVLNITQIRDLETSNRKVFADKTNMAITILITNGTYTDANVLGVAYRNTSAALFGKLIHDNSGGVGQPSRYTLEASVLEHEVAHLIGLVDIGTKMVANHKDASHGNHCSNQNCLMYYASETTDVLTALVGGSIPSLDADCLNDLKANGGK